MDVLREIDVIWMILCIALVLFMQVGFLFLESGLVRSKNTIHVALKNVIDLGIAGCLYGAFGYALMFNLDVGWWRDVDGADHSRWVHFAYQIAFCGTAATIISGAVAERMRLEGFMVIAALTAVVFYPTVGGWIWGNNEFAWLRHLGFIDFAGSTVVHSTGGWIALAAVLVIGPRTGRFSSDSAAFKGQNISSTAVGALILWIGWMGFNAGSYLRMDDLVPLMIVNTLFAGIGGIVTGVLSSFARDGLVQVEHVVHGLLGGLVAVTAGCHAIHPDSAFVIGSIGALIAILGAELMARLRLDDVVGAVPVHAFAGVWGTVAVAWFGDLEILGTGLSRFDQLQVQLLGALSVGAWTLVGGLGIFWSINKLVPLRCSGWAEEVGLNVSEHGASSELLELIQRMETQVNEGDFSKSVRVDAHSEVGKIAFQYNKVLEQVVEQSDISNKNAERAELAQKQAEQAQKDLEERLEELSRFNRSTIGREHRMIELKAQINALLSKQGLPERYNLEFVEK